MAIGYESPDRSIHQYSATEPLDFYKITYHKLHDSKPKGSSQQDICASYQKLFYLCTQGTKLRGLTRNVISTVSDNQFAGVWSETKYRGKPE